MRADAARILTRLPTNRAVNTGTTRRARAHPKSTIKMLQKSEAYTAPKNPYNGIRIKFKATNAVNWMHRFTVLARSLPVAFKSDPNGNSTYKNTTAKMRTLRAGMEAANAGQI